MTLPSRLLIKTSLIYLLIGSAMGTLLLINKAYLFEPALWALLPVHIELMIFGWIIQFTLGVAYWILPRYLQGEARGSSTFAYLMVIFLNAGILLMVFSELGLLPDIYRVAARTLESMAVILFVALHWNRVVTYNK